MDDLKARCELYLYFSYVPRFSDANAQWFNYDFETIFGQGIIDEAWWVKEGVRTLREMLASQIASAGPNATHIIPLSGGLDSRVIFGGLLENVPRSQIIAATYGIPGSWDLEVSKTIARKFGIQHEIFNLLEEKWDYDNLAEAATHLKYPVSVYQSYVRRKIVKHFGPDCIYWSGFMGDAIGGVDLPPVPNTEKRAAASYHINLEFTKNYKDQAFQDRVIDQLVAQFPWDCPKEQKLTLDQRLYFGLRQAQLTQQIVVLNDSNIKTPFLDEKWVNFMLNAPYQWLVNQHLYQKIICAAYPELAKLPVTATAGMPVAAPLYQIYLGKALAKLKPYLMPTDPFHSHPRTNYINWTESLRHTGSLQSLVQETLKNLKKRAIFNEKDLDAWWLDHLNRKKDYTVLLMNLSSLELLLQAGKF